MALYGTIPPFEDPEIPIDPRPHPRPGPTWTSFRGFSDFSGSMAPLIAAPALRRPRSPRHRPGDGSYGLGHGKWRNETGGFHGIFYGFYRGLVECSMKFHGISKVTEGFISFIGRSSQHLKLVWSLNMWKLRFEVMSKIVSKDWFVGNLQESPIFNGKIHGFL